MDQSLEKTSKHIRPIAIVACIVALTAISCRNYLLFHTMVELAGITVAYCTFVIAWNSRGFARNAYLLFLGLASPFCAGLSLLHTLAYKGMGVFPGAGANLPTQLWIGTSGLWTASLLAAAIAAGRRPNPTWVVLCYAGICGLFLASVFLWPLFPACYVEGVGLTPAKRIGEYLICTGLCAALFALQRVRAHFDADVLRLLQGALVAALAAEVCFTLYINVYGPVNFLGHMLRLASVYLVYLAVVDTSFRAPYALLFRELKRSEEDLHQAREQLHDAYQRDHRIAIRFQAALLPPAETRLAGYEIGHIYKPALREADVGGVFYNVFPIDAERTGLVIGDVGGKGLEAAVVAARAQHAIMALALDAKAPGTILTTTRRVVTTEDPDQIVTIFLAILEHDTGTLHWSNAGHPPALITRAGRREVEPLEPHGPPLIGFSMGDYATSTSHLGPGDGLLLYTDGLSEAHVVPNGELLGEERVYQMLVEYSQAPPDALIERMYDAVLDQSNGHPHDDVALLFVRRSAPGMVRGAHETVGSARH